MSNSIPTSRRFFDRLLIVVFCVGLSLPTAGRWLGWSTPYDPGLEKRAAAKFPYLECRRLGPFLRPLTRSLISYPNRFEAFFNDNYGFRTEMVQAYAQARVAGLVPAGLERPAGTGQSCVGVLIGLNGWLYLDGDSIDNYRAVKPYTSAEIESWSRTLCERSDWLAERGMRYLFFVAPEKPAIYPEYLPPSINRVGRFTRLDQLTERLTAVCPAAYLDLRPALLAAKSSRPLYFQIDTHWNTCGAWVGYQEVIRKLQGSFPHLALQAASDYDVVPHSSRGDLESILPASNWPEANGYVMQAKRPVPVVVHEGPIEITPGSYDPGWRAHNPTVARGRALVIHDSFFLNIMPFMNEQWRDVTYIHMRNGFPTDLIERERPDVVIHEIVERTLMKAPPVDAPRPALPRDVRWAEQPGRAVR
jgi:alginate O-acetyltransferase complex protein AlgJ